MDREEIHRMTREEVAEHGDPEAARDGSRGAGPRGRGGPALPARTREERPLVATGWEHTRRDPNDERRSGDDRLRDPVLGPLVAGHFVRSSGDPDEEERLRAERVEARKDARRAALRRRHGRRSA